jgi:mannose-6-phosphate isomerase-like protein (cupin superfamily)
MKRVVTGVNEQGRSYIVSIDELDPASPSTVWAYEPSQVLDWINAIEPGVAADWIGPQVSGGVVWHFAPMPPESEVTQHQSYQGIDEEGFHTTKTIDFDFIFEGQLTMVLDEGRVELEKGDFVIQQATRHAWHNESDKVAILLALIHRPQAI